MQSFKQYKFLYLLILTLIFISQNNKLNFGIYEKRIGVINLPNGQNVGNILVKFAMFKLLKGFGLNATIITPKLQYPEIKVDLSFIHRTLNSHFVELKDNFSELNEKDYDYLVVNSDQTWVWFGKYFFDIAFLKFAENWRIPKFIYATSIGRDYWPYNKMIEKEAKKLLKSFTGISFREKGLVKLAKKKLGIKGVFVLDPTLLLEKEYYLKEIKDYKNNFFEKEKFIFVYQLHENKILERIANDSSKKFNYKIFKLEFDKSDYIESFIFGINTSQAVLTDSFHGTIFSIMFNKPFLSFMDTTNTRFGKGRFDSLKEVFCLEKRIIDPLKSNNISLNLLKEIPNINQTLFNELKSFSIDYIKKNLDIL
jgi:hypothetical protein